MKKANSVDGMSAYMLKATAESVVSPLAKVFSPSLSTGKLPKLWKSVRVVPILQSGSRSDVSNYRPISLLPIVSKMLERYVYITLGSSDPIMLLSLSINGAFNQEGPL